MKIFISVLIAVLCSGPVCAERLCGVERLESFDRLPELLEGTRAMQVSTHDRDGANSDGWYGTYSYLYQDENDEYVLLDEQGAGCIYRMWTTYSQGSGNATNRFRVYFDDETTPRIDTTLGAFFSGTNAPFIFPLTGDKNVSSGGYFNYVPLPYQRRCKITVSAVQRPFYYNFTWHTLDSTDGVQTWTGAEDLSSVTSMWTSVGADPKPADETPSVVQGVADVPAFGMTNLLVRSEPGTISVLKIDPEIATTNLLTNLWVRMTWDGASEPQVYAPLGLFFGTGFGEHEVRSLPIGMSSSNAYYCYFPMPFWSDALVQLENKGATTVSDIAYEISAISNRYEQTHAGHFYATARSSVLTSDPDDRDYIVLDEEGRGHYVGCVLAMQASHENEDLDLRYLEGDERIYVDGSLSPSIYGTGNEDYFNGGWYFNKGAFTLPCHGAPYLDHDAEPTSRTNRTSAYRFHLSDVIPFRTQFRFGIEHGDCYRSRNLPGAYSSVAFFYKQPRLGLVLSAQLDVGNSVSEQTFQYSAEGGSFVTNAWCYEGVSDDVSVSDTGRIFTGFCSFSVPVTATNQGALLRRRTDQGLNPQSAEIFVGGESVGIWALVDTNFSAVTKCWLDSEFEIPWAYTAGKTNLNIRIEPEGTSWNEYRYQVYSVVPLLFSPDKDADEIPDSWEARYFANIRSALPEEDGDGDGHTLGEEYIAGTSPVDAGSIFELTQNNGNFEFFAVSNRTYQVWFRTNLVEGAWQSVTNFQGSETIFSIEPSEAPVGFYRAEVQK